MNASSNVCLVTIVRGLGETYHSRLGSSSAAARGNLTCVYCRAKWISPNSASGSSNVFEGYLNLAHVAGLGPERDTSTCEFKHV
jgi:hypothetical protein